MSGQPLRKIGDAEVFRKQYIANLQLMSKIDDVNLQANKTYKRTGQIPELTDYRTLSEKLADIERIKIDVRNKLLTITDGINAQQIITNINDNAILFLSNQFEPISQFMKKNYSLGVLADIFIDYLERYMQKFEANQGIENNLQQQMNELIFNSQAILSQMPSAGEIRNLNLAIIRGNLFNKRKQEQINELFRFVMVQNDDIKYLIKETKTIDNAIQKNQLEELLSDAFQNIPKKDDIREFMEGLSRPIDLENRDKLTELSDNISSLFETAQMNAGDIVVIRQLLEEYKSEKVGGGEVEGEVELEPIEAVAVGEKSPKGMKVLEGRKITKKEISDSIKSQLHPYLTQLKKDIKAYYTNIPKLDPQHNEIKLMLNQLTDDIKAVSSDSSSTANKVDVDNLKAILKDANTQQLMILVYPEVEGKGMCGGSIYRQQKRYDVIDKDDIDFSKGIKASPKYVPFGSHIIHKNQLDKDIVSIRRIAGSSVGNLPSSRVSKKLGGMLRKIIGGGIPSFDELNSLDDDEKAFLHKVAKETRIDDKISIPTPKKDEEEKLINEFEILKGQIMAGNDNVELLRKFRICLVKMGNKGLIPKTQMKELLIDIATL